MQAAAAAGSESLICTSSCAIYGDSDALPLVESSVPRPMSPYAASKLANEAYAAGFRVFAPRLNTVGLRFFNTFGAWQDAGSGYAAVIPKWIDTLLAGKQPILFGDGGATRDFCHVDNVCQAIWQSAAAGASASGVYNVASEIPTRLDALYDAIVAALKDAGYSRGFPQADYQPWRVGEILHSYGNPKKAKSELNFNVEVSLARRTQAYAAGRVRRAVHGRYVNHRL